MDDLIRKLRCQENTDCTNCQMRYEEECDTDFVRVCCAAHEAAGEIEKLRRVIEIMKPKYNAICVKCKHYDNAEFTEDNFLRCPESGMTITAWDWCSYYKEKK